MKSSFALNGLENGEVFSDLKMLAKKKRQLRFDKTICLCGWQVYYAANFILHEKTRIIKAQQNALKSTQC